MPEPAPNTVIIAMLESAGAAMIYSFLWYYRRYEQTGEPFEYAQFLSTLIVGGAIGLSLALAGVDVTAGAVEARIVLYAGAISLVEALLKAGMDHFGIEFPRPAAIQLNRR